MHAHDGHFPWPAGTQERGKAPAGKLRFRFTLVPRPFLCGNKLVLRSVYGTWPWLLIVLLFCSFLRVEKHVSEAVRD